VNCAGAPDASDALDAAGSADPVSPDDVVASPLPQAASVAAKAMRRAGRRIRFERMRSEPARPGSHSRRSNSALHRPLRKQRSLLRDLSFGEQTHGGELVEAAQRLRRWLGRRRGVQQLQARDGVPEPGGGRRLVALQHQRLTAGAGHRQRGGGQSLADVDLVDGKALIAIGYQLEFSRLKTRTSRRNVTAVARVTASLVPYESPSGVELGGAAWLVTASA